MREALAAIFDFGFENMNLQFIEAEVERANLRSIKLLEHLGFNCEDTEEGKPLIYLLSRNDWQTKAR